MALRNEFPKVAEQKTVVQNKNKINSVPKITESINENRRLSKKERREEGYGSLQSPIKSEFRASTCHC